MIRWISNLKKSYYRNKNYREFQESGLESRIGDLPYSVDKVEQSFIDNGFAVEPYIIDEKKYGDYHAKFENKYAGYGDYRHEKALEHFVSFQFCDLNSESKVIDVANAGSGFPDILNNIFGCKVWSNDLDFKPGIRKVNDWHTRVGCDACHLPVDDNYFDLMVLHCALEMFEGESDIGLVKEASRVLKPGGKLVIIPLYMNEIYHVLRDPQSPRYPLPKIDEGAHLIYRDEFHEVAFARFYNPGAFKSRLVDGQLKVQILKVENNKEIDQSCYLKWIGIFEK